MLLHINAGYPMNQHTLLKNALLISMASLLFLGCSGTGPKHKEYDKKIAVGAYKDAAIIAASAKNKKEEGLDDGHLLATMKAGNGYLYAKEYQKSIDMLDESEKIIKYHREQILAGSAGDYLAQILLTDAAVDYQGTITEAVLLNTYKSIDYMMIHDYAGARVELNRAIDRQRRAKETYAELIGKQKAAIAKKENEKGGASTSRTLNSKELDGVIESNYSNLKGFQAYPDFVNPFTTYLAGLFFMIEGDYSKSSPLLKEAFAMMPQNSTTKTDFEMVENALSGKPIRKNYVWIIYENGLGPYKKEIKVNIPIWLVSNDLIYTGLALPRMEYGKQATADLSVYHNAQMLATTQEVADLNRVIHTEFKYIYGDIVRRAVLSTIVKTYIQYETKKVNQWAGLATAIFQAASTRADTRIWSSLPQGFQVTRVEMPEDRKLQLKAGYHNMNVALSANAKHSIVYVRIPTAGSKPSVSVANF